MRRPVLLLGVAALVIAGVFLLRRSTAPVTMSATPTEQPERPPQPLTEQPTAHSAALRIVRLTGDIATAGFISRGDLVGVLASQRYAPVLRRAVDAQLAELTSAVGAVGVPASDLLWEEYPLTIEVRQTDNRRATITIWSVLIIGAPGHGAARQVWRTSTIDLVVEVGEWRVDGWAAVPGPTPTLDVAGPISDFAAVAQATQRQSAIEGAG